MSERPRPAPARTPTRTRDGLQSVLVPTDLSAASDRVLGRLSKLPVAQGGLVTLLHVVPGGLSPRQRRDVEHDAKESLVTEARHLATALPPSVRVRSAVKAGPAATVIAEFAAAQAAELIVMGRGSGRTWRDTFLGSTAERVMRTARLPVLAVRLAPRGPYHQPAMAIDLDEAAPRVVDWLLRLVPPPRPRLEVLHAFRAPFENLLYPSLPREDLEERRAELRHDASIQLAGILTQALARAGLAPGEIRWKVHVRHGSARTVIAKAVKQSQFDLLVLGTHGYAGLAHTFLGSVAGDVLRQVECDVLVVPPPEST